ncbi:hypothetical protein CANCADRAFT_94746 [Tortispora caseinolytica NRRL Y-17796]|uniref:Threonyl/alanyl tRNA synthetase SAD domain-containing protein n=1 Tax=Tortispora caseinolytica NRRL Y-17796 TaxID=767744 RepID=A0A1E4TM97_9ASCO|nr:hypothetical protein CANCADRAFT_94746 [Tortispora caseinolytica NRRL Y-17796]
MSYSIVGALACQKDSYRTTLDSHVVECRKNGKHYELLLHDTIVFPEGGGQPSDIAELKLADGKSISITECKREKLKAYHSVNEPLDPHTPISISLDWQRRYDHMQQHTGQHLVSAIFDQLNLPTLSWNMGDPLCYIELPRKVTDDEVALAQQRIDNAISQAIAISVETPEHDAAPTSKLPDDYDAEKGVVRVIKIGDLDANPCCGTHLKSTHEIGSIVLLHQTAVRGTNSRLHFVAGRRVAKYLSSLNQLARTLNTRLSCQQVDIVDKVDALQLKLKDTTRAAKIYSSLAAQIELERMKDVEPGDFFLIFRPDSSAFASEYIQTAMTAAKDSEFTLVAIAADPDTGGSVTCVGPNAIEAAECVKAAFPAVKGGGKGSRWQGKLAKFPKGSVDELLSTLESKFSQLSLA